MYIQPSTHREIKEKLKKKMKEIDNPALVSICLIADMLGCYNKHYHK